MKRILIIDDEQQISLTVRSIFRDEPYEFDTASDGPEGLRCAETHPPDLVIVDLLLPRMHGFEIISRLRANPLTARVPILVLSAKVYPPDRRKALSLGANEFVEKPFSIDALYSMVQTQLRQAA